MPGVYRAAARLLPLEAQYLAELSSLTTAMSSAHARTADAHAMTTLQEFAASCADLAAATSRRSREAAASVAAGGATATASGGSPSATVVNDEYVVADDTAASIPVARPAMAQYVTQGAPPEPQLGHRSPAYAAADYPASGAHLAAYAQARSDTANPFAH